MVGVFRANSPTLIIRDPELIRDVAVKSFRNFQDNELIIDKKDDPLLGRHPFFIGGEEWRTTRVLLTPGFTSGKVNIQICWYIVSIAHF
jgi:cytochrome P450